MHFLWFSFNQLCLPDYETYEHFERALLIAIKEGSEGFGLIWIGQLNEISSQFNNILISVFLSYFLSDSVYTPVFASISPPKGHFLIAIRNLFFFFLLAFFFSFHVWPLNTLSERKKYYLALFQLPPSCSHFPILFLFKAFSCYGLLYISWTYSVVCYQRIYNTMKRE